MTEVIQVVTGILIGSLIGSAIVAGYLWLDYRLWLRQFRKEWRIEREQWFSEHQECCELDGSYLSETARLTNG